MSHCSPVKPCHVLTQPEFKRQTAAFHSPQQDGVAGGRESVGQKKENSWVEITSNN